MIVKVTEYYFEEHFDPEFLAWIYSVPTSYLALLYKEWYSNRRISDKEIQRFEDAIKNWKF